MLTAVEKYIEKLIELAKERDQYREYSKKLIITIRKLEKDYQKGKIGYSEYEKARYHYLKGKTLEQALQGFKSYIEYASGQLQQLHSHVFYQVYNDKSYLNIKITPKPLHLKQLPVFQENRKTSSDSVLVKEKKSLFGKLLVRPLKKKTVEQIPVNEIEKSTFSKSVEKTPVQVIKEKIFIKQEIPVKHIDQIEQVAERVIMQKSSSKGVPLTELEAKQVIQAEKKAANEREEEFIPSAIRELRGEEEKEEKEDRRRLGIEADHGIAQEVLVAKQNKQRLVKPSKEVEKEARNEFFKELFGKPKSKLSDKQHVDVLEQLFHSKLEERTFIGEKTRIPTALIELETLKRKAEEAEIKFDYKRFVKERESGFFSKLKKRKSEKPKEKPTSPWVRIGAVANLTVRPIGNRLITRFPEFFESLYRGLRFANMPVLSNTYVNIIVLLVILSSAFFFFFFFLVFLFRGATVSEIILKSLLTSLIAGAGTFTALYAYPFTKQDERAKAIRKNIPFALNHMSAIASSGISPVKMFKLISESSDEYGVVSEEMQKISNYVDIFGYDLSSAVEAVSATTASTELKSFLEGLLSTLNTGGDIGLYLRQKSDEALAAYKLEREKYIETISTYSDVYTGILIAAPLFFISILSLVSILGGTVMGFGVSIIMAFGTYFLIPLFNLIFIGFLQITKVDI